MTLHGTERLTKNELILLKAISRREIKSWLDIRDSSIFPSKDADSGGVDFAFPLDFCESMVKQWNRISFKLNYMLDDIE